MKNLISYGLLLYLLIFVIVFLSPYLDYTTPTILLIITSLLANSLIYYGEKQYEKHFNFSGSSILTLIGTILIIIGILFYGVFEHYKELMFQNKISVSEFDKYDWLYDASVLSIFGFFFVVFSIIKLGKRFKIYEFKTLEYVTILCFLLFGVFYILGYMIDSNNLDTNIGLIDLFEYTFSSILIILFIIGLVFFYQGFSKIPSTQEKDRVNVKEIISRSILWFSISMIIGISFIPITNIIGEIGLLIHNKTLWDISVGGYGILMVISFIVFPLSYIMAYHYYSNVITYCKDYVNTKKMEKLKSKFATTAILGIVMFPLLLFGIVTGLSDTSEPTIFDRIMFFVGLGYLLVFLYLPKWLLEGFEVLEKKFGKNTIENNWIKLIIGYIILGSSFLVSNHSELLIIILSIGTGIIDYTYWKVLRIRDEVCNIN